jgi:hypothetical protein
MPDYDQLRDDALLHLTSQRGLQPAGPQWLTVRGGRRNFNRKAFIDVLKQADAVWPDGQHFPLMTLPKELRERIYWELLVRSDSRSIWPAIVLASRVVYAETSETMFRENEIDIRLTNLGLLCRGNMFCRFDIDLNKEGDTNWGLDIRSLKWPPWLRKCQWLEFVIDWDPWRAKNPWSVQFFGPNAYARQLNGIMYGLCSAMQDDNKLSSMSVTFDNIQMTLTTDRLQAIFSPL